MKTDYICMSKNMGWGLKWEAYYKRDTLKWTLIGLFRNNIRYQVPINYISYKSCPPSCMLDNLSYGAMSARMRKVKTYDIYYMKENDVFLAIL